MFNTSRQQGHYLKLRKDRPRLDLRKFTFCQTVVNMWNDLPADVATASTLRVFKNQLEAHLKTSQDGRQSNLNSTHRSSVFTSASLGYLYASVNIAGICPTAMLKVIFQLYRRNFSASINP